MGIKTQRPASAWLAHPALSVQVYVCESEIMYTVHVRDLADLSGGDADSSKACDVECAVDEQLTAQPTML